MSHMSTVKDPSSIDLAQTKCLVTYGPISQSQNHGSSSIVVIERPYLLAGQGSTGFRTWSAALHLGSYLVNEGQALVQGKDILELGAGTGFLSILCSAIGARKVMSTDGDLGVLSGIHENINLDNNVRHFKTTSRIQPLQLRWGLGEVKGHLKSIPADFQPQLIIGADVTYEADALCLLVSTLETCCRQHPQPTVVISATVRNPATITTFKSLCSKRNLAVEEIPYNCPSPSDQPGLFHHHDPPIELLAISPQE
ncbi:MAG: hypothetical protein Q9227_000374 [Pyrenula ochraceoflavens]